MGDAQLRYWETRLRGDERSYVYVIQADPGTPIKIGIAVDPRKRLRTLQTAYPWRLHLLFVVPGQRATERILHSHLADCRMEGEWFDGPEIPEFLQWMHDYCESAITCFREKGIFPPPLPLPPKGPEPKPPHKGMRNKGYHYKLGHRWRLSDDTEHPVKTRFVDPATLRS